MPMLTWSTPTLVTWCEQRANLWRLPDELLFSRVDYDIRSPSTPPRNCTGTPASADTHTGRYVPSLPGRPSRRSAVSRYCRTSVGRARRSVPDARGDSVSPGSVAGVVAVCAASYRSPASIHGQLRCADACRVALIRSDGGQSFRARRRPARYRAHRVASVVDPPPGRLSGVVYGAPPSVTGATTGGREWSRRRADTCTATLAAPRVSGARGSAAPGEFRRCRATVAAVCRSKSHTTEIVPIYTSGRPGVPPASRQRSCSFDDVLFNSLFR